MSCNKCNCENCTKLKNEFFGASYRFLVGDFGIKIYDIVNDGNEVAFLDASIPELKKAIARYEELKK